MNEITPGVFPVQVSRIKMGQLPGDFLPEKRESYANPAVCRVYMGILVIREELRVIFVVSYTAVCATEEKKNMLNE